jgi:hypothetical protein
MHYNVIVPKDWFVKFYGEKKNSAKTGVFMTIILKVIGFMSARSFNNK